MQRAASVIMRGGLDLVTPAIALRPGTAIASLNYEPVPAGYRRIDGYERFDGRPSPSGSADPEAARALIEAVPGVGPVRGVWVYNGALHVFRDQPEGGGAMFRSTSGGWARQDFGRILSFNTGTAAFALGEIVTGGTSGASARVERIALLSGTFGGGDALGYLVVSDQNGSFEVGEGLTSASGAAEFRGEREVTIEAGGRYTFANHNFYGAIDRLRMYFCNGLQTAFEWDGRVLSPIAPGQDVDLAEFAGNLLNAAGGFILTAGGGKILMPNNTDMPISVAEYQGHLFLAYRRGSILFSGLGDPFDWRVVSGAGELAVGDEITGFLTSNTALLIFCRSRLEYIGGTSQADFHRRTVSANSGAYSASMQEVGSPVFLDDGGIRSLQTVDAFGDWRQGTLSQAVEPLVKALQRGVGGPTASLVVKAKDQYRLFWGDKGLTLYTGAKAPEIMPFALNISVTCACRGVIPDAGDSMDRLFVGATNGFVYEMDAGRSFDGDPVEANLRLAWNSTGDARRNKRFHRAFFEFDAPSDALIGVSFEVDYGTPGNAPGLMDADTLLSGARSDSGINAITGAQWARPDVGVLDVFLNGLGRNIALSLMSETADAEPFTLTAMSINYTPRKAVR